MTQCLILAGGGAAKGRTTHTERNAQAYLVRRVVDDVLELLAHQLEREKVPEPNAEEDQLCARSRKEEHAIKLSVWSAQTQDYPTR